MAITNISQITDKKRKEILDLFYNKQGSEQSPYDNRDKTIALKTNISRQNVCKCISEHLKEIEAKGYGRE